MTQTIADFIKQVVSKNPGQPVFHQAVQRLLDLHFGL